MTTQIPANSTYSNTNIYNETKFTQQNNHLDNIVLNSKPKGMVSHIPGPYEAGEFPCMSKKYDLTNHRTGLLCVHFLH